MIERSQVRNNDRNEGKTEKLPEARKRRIEAKEVGREQKKTK
jgi:hypothetical protein